MHPGRSGILLVDKPAGLTSHDVVARVRRLASTRRVGHAGTLDPMATGLLVLGINSATRLLTFLVGLDKEYEATIRLGVATATDDAQGEPVHAPRSTTGLTARDIEREVTALTGELQQVPSTVSAIKVGGRRAYDLARAGESVVLAARPVTVSRFDVVEVRRTEWLDVDVRVECSSGTYVRALARDLGDALGVGAHLTALRRTRVGPFGVAPALRLDPDRGSEPVPLDAHLLDPAKVAAQLFATVQLDADESRDLAHGKRIRLSTPVVSPPDAAAAHASDAPIAALAPDGRLIGLVEVTAGVARVLVNFPSSEVLQ